MTISVTKDIVAAVLSRIKYMSQKSVYVGYPDNGGARQDDSSGKAPATNAQLAYIHEHGSPARNIPARPFLSVGVKNVEERAVKILKDEAVKLVDGKVSSIDAGLDKAGQVARDGVKRAITVGEGFAPLSDQTIKARERKGYKGKKPLIRTGQLRNSVSYVVRNREQNG